MTAAAVGGGLALGVVGPRVVRRLAPNPATTKLPVPFRTWLEIGRDGIVTVVIPNAEMGQDVDTTLAMLVAEELDVDWRSIRARQATFDPVYRMPASRRQETNASLSLRGRFFPMRRAGAAARLMLIAAAAAAWRVPDGECTTSGGRVLHAASNREAAYGDLAEAAARTPVPQNPPLRKSDAYRILGRSVPSLDTEAIIQGTAVFGIDVSVPDAWQAAIRQSPVFGGEVASVDDAAILAKPGVKAVVKLPDAVAVVADTYWRAQSALDAAAITFRGGATAGLDSAAIDRRLTSALNRQGAQMRKTGTLAQAEATAARVVRATYTAPFQTHLPLEPMNCTVSWTSDRCEIWTGTQVHERVVEVASKITGLPPSRIVLHNYRSGGAFGRRQEVDVVEQALAIAREVRHPVKLTWSRAEDVQHGFYRAALAAGLRAALTADGKMASLWLRVAGPSTARRVDPRRFAGGRDFTTMWGLTNHPYEIPNQEVEYVHEEVGVPVGWMRGVAHTANAWALESFVDEAAHAASRDPLSFRRDLITEPRGLRVLDRAATRAGWTSSLRAGRGRGLSFIEGGKSYLATIVELVRTGDHSFAIDRITAVVDCGFVVHPDVARAQVEGAILYGLSGALREAITLRDGRVEQSNLHDYPILRATEVPPIDVAFIESDDEPTGIGELGTVGLAPALGNALFALTGQRVRSLPLSASGWRMTPK